MLHCRTDPQVQGMRMLFAGQGLYQFHELWRAGMAPYTYWAEAGAKMFSAPGSWLAGMPEATRVAAGCELLYRIGKDYEKPEFGLHEVEIDGAAYPVV
jgi:poly(3-hydroxybutyrate) depolymerase